MHLQQKPFIEKSSVNKGALKKGCYALQCYVHVIKIFDKYL